ncbi:MAG TPA: sulfatase [Pseudonocardia sp.]|nr:sulfatase [Pseudonocardia sp.]
MALVMPARPRPGRHRLEPEVVPAPREQRSGRRAAVGRVVSVLAFLLVYLALVAPNEFGQVVPGAFLRIPAEALVGVLLVLVLPGRARSALALVGGAVLGLLTVVRVLDMGFMTALARPFDPVFDWGQLLAAVPLFESSMGEIGAVAAAVGIGLSAVALVALIALATLRLSRLVERHRTAAARAVPVVGVAWLVCFGIGAQIVVPVPVAALSTVSLAQRTAVQVPTTLRDYQAFLDQAARPDPFAGTPAAELLSGLRGKDVVLSFVESYGRSAVEHPEIAPRVNAALDGGTDRLAAAGYSARSAFLTSPVIGGGSWLAHATLLSGLWVTNEQSYRTLVDGERLTLTSAFERADWRTVGVMPGVTRDWPEGEFYGIEQLYDYRNLGYAGEKFSGFHTPDQYTLSAFERFEHGADRGPLMAEIPLVTSHWPWAPLPPTVDWDQIGDGSVYDTLPDAGLPVEDVWGGDPGLVKDAYARSVEYSLTSLISWVERYGDDDLVLVFLGDHQPAPVATGEGAGRDVPITVVTRDRAVLDRIAGWGWDEGLRPGPQAPVSRMDTFRDQFLTAFGPEAHRAQ